MRNTELNYRFEKINIFLNLLSIFIRILAVFSIYLIILNIIVSLYQMHFNKKYRILINIFYKYKNDCVSFETIKFSILLILFIITIMEIYFNINFKLCFKIILLSSLLWIDLKNVYIIYGI